MYYPGIRQDTLNKTTNNITQ